MHRFIAFHGFDGSGKSTAARMVPDAEIISIASGLKAIATQMGWMGGKAPRDRRFLRQLGMLGREYEPECWVNDWLHRAQACSARRIVVDDLRFENEARIIHRMGGIIIRVEREDATPPWWLPLHPSERPLPERYIDRVIHNDGDLHDLRDAVIDALA